MMPTLLLWVNCWKGRAGETTTRCCLHDSGTGVGGGIVAEGRLLHGVRGAALVSLSRKQDAITA